MTAEPILPAYIDSTMRSCFVGCPHKFFLEFVLGLRGKGKSIDLHAGGCFASAIEHVGKRVYGERVPVETALLSAHAEFLMNWGDFEITKDTPKTKERTWEAVENYYETYPPLSDHVQPLYVDDKPTIEFNFAVPLDGPGFPRHPVTNDPFIYTGRFDMLGELARSPCIKDEKSTTSIGAAWSEQWQLRAQLLGYVWATNMSGIRLDTVCIRGVGILKTKFHQVEAIIRFSEWEIERWYEQFRRDLIRLVRCFEDGHWDWNLGETCNSYGGCQFRSTICTSQVESRWYDNFEVKRWNPLLKNPVEEGDKKCLDTSAAPAATLPSLPSTSGSGSPLDTVKNWSNG